jgi:hypothetical protein
MGKSWLSKFALLCLLIVGMPMNIGHAQGDGAWGLVGQWVNVRPAPVNCRYSYNLTAVSVSEIRLRLTSTSGGCTAAYSEFRLSLRGRNLRGAAVTHRNTGGSFCNFPIRTFGAAGRVLNNGRTMIVTVRAQVQGVRPCRWLSRTEDYSFRFTR